MKIFDEFVETIATLRAPGGCPWDAEQTHESIKKNLIEEKGRLDLPGRPIAYKTTDNFLRSFQLSGLGDLPPVPDKQEQITIDEITAETEDE